MKKRKRMKRRKRYLRRVVEMEGAKALLLTEPLEIPLP